MSSLDPVARWGEYATKNPKIQFVWLRFMSHKGTILTRIVPQARFASMLQTGKHISVPKAAFYLDPSDVLAEGGSPSGKMSLQPDLTTIRSQAGSNGTRAVVMCDCLEADGSPAALCPRSRLQGLTSKLDQELGFSALVGFEVEVIFLRPETENGKTQYQPVNQTHCWSSMTVDDQDLLGLIEAIAHGLAEAGITLEHFHAEAAQGQWEFVLPPATPVEAVDMLIEARETIRSIAHAHGLHATLHPRISPVQAGTGAHVHLSVEKTREGSRDPESFFAGIIDHMPAILAFSLPQVDSYQRVATGTWSGGEYACWGWENKEAALRRIEYAHFELKLCDGFANPYLVLSALLTAGMTGLHQCLLLQAGDCTKSSGDLTSEEREALGIRVKLPKTLDESLAALEGDPIFQSSLGPAIMESYLAVKKAEARFFKALDVDDRKSWLIARY
ncbi:hypothetical protein BDV25DRAFT_47011 [Aspergillus avenaceus]|uniref:Glutamine synthetase n=1 Tax=Aspergillus avenaceus TaxID=36643 RepID=A0A5N6TK08_ASPAV|nr:hypothetical protein BDV25DRAFT_47011 [Aspergillus avenaceus]